MKTKQILLFFLIVFSLENGVAQIIAPENPGASNFPGGYIALAIQSGKNSKGVKFWSYQATIGVALPHPEELSILPFVGLTIGKRKFKNNTSYTYNDIQLAISPYTGIGFGKAKVDEKLYNRLKGWLGFGPFIYSGDWLYMPDEKIANSGLMLSIPVTIIFGNQFMP